MLIQVSDKQPLSRPMPVPGARNFAAFLLFGKDENVDESAILDALRRRASVLGAPFSVSATTERRMRERRVTGTFRRRLERVELDLRLAKVRLAVSVSDGPGERGYWSRYVDNQAWPDAFESIGRERCFVSILEHGDADGSQGRDAAYDRALATTLVADAVSELDDPLAVLWHPARQALSPEKFYHAIRPLQQSRSPLELWACLRPLDGGNGPAGVATEGLLPLLGREIEVPPSTLDTRRVARIAIELATALLDGDASISDGDCWTGSTTDGMRVKLGESASRSGIPVWELRPMAVGHT